MIVSLLASAHAAAQESEMLLFQDKEEGLDPYLTRIIVTPTQIRFDDGENSKSYTLYDRATHIARTVDTRERTVLELHPKQVKVEPPFALKFRVKELGELKDAPKIMGKTPKHYQDYTNDKLCFDVITVEGLMPQAVKALTEFRELLASDSKVTFNNMPADLQDPCTIAMDTFAPTRYLQHGFPIQEWHPGYSRTLVNYDEHFKPDPKLFEIPQGYFTFTVEQIRNGDVDMDKRKIRDQQSAKSG